MTSDADDVLTFRCVTPVAVLSMAPTNHDFGNLLVGAPAVSKVFTVTNTGTAASGPIITSLFSLTAFSFGTDNCVSATLAPLATCTITVIYTPATAGQSLGSLVADALSAGGVTAAGLRANAVLP